MLTMRFSAEWVRVIASEDDTLMLVSAACSIVLRKDLSLSRRLYTWFLGNGEEDGVKQSERFRKQGMGLVIKSLRVSLQLYNKGLVCELIAPFRCRETSKPLIVLTPTSTSRETLK
jgi:hypothetical protein